MTKTFAVAFAFVAAAFSGCAATTDVAVDSDAPDALEEAESDLSLRLCAGPRGLTCGAGQYCNSARTGLCPSKQQVGICAARPRACTKEYRPVCGCDGKTYGNACTAAAAGVAVKAQGECAVDASCASDADCTGGKFCAFAEGACGGKGTCQARPEICITLFKPVCGCDGKTYSNSCAAAGAGASVDYQGPCLEGSFCGGIAGIACPEGEQCVDDPSDDCDPQNGGADCGGICVCPTNPCAVTLCPTGTECVVNGCQASCEPPPGDDGCGGCGPGNYCCDPLHDRCVRIGMLCAF